MSLYNVVGTCVVNHLHYVRPTTEPIEVDDAEADPLVAEGKLEPYRPGEVACPLGWPADAKQPADGGPYAPVLDDDEPPTDLPPARRPRGKRTGA